MKIVYAGTPSFAVEPLKRLLEGGYSVVGVVTGEDKRQGRKGILTPSPVKVLAQEFDIPIFQPKKIREEVETLASFGADVMVTCAYGQILTQEVIDLFPKGVWNIHAGLLPKYRGASPIQNAILAGETETGVCIMQTVLGVDEGGILHCEKTHIGDAETSGELSSRLSVLGADGLIKALPLIEKGDCVLEKQAEEGVQIFKKIPTDAGKLDFTKDGQTLVNTIRAFNPDPSAYAFLNGNRVNVWRAEFLPAEEKLGVFGEIVSEKPKQGLLVQCLDGLIKLIEVQPSGGKRMSGGDFLNGRKGEKGQVFEW